MSAGEPVLQLMDACAERLHVDDSPELAEALWQARDAVAKLIDEARKCVDVGDDPSDLHGALVGLGSSDLPEKVECGGTAPPVQASPITHDPAHLFDNVIVQLRPGVLLRISRQSATQGCAALYIGAYQPDNRVLSAPFRIDAARLTHAPRKAMALWLGNIVFELPWVELLKAADFLLLPLSTLSDAHLWSEGMR